jgi:molecular chaperone GrpE (heat shock protein)
MTKNQKTKKLKTQVENAEQNDLKNQLVRVMADYDNLKKRSEDERNQMYKLASISFFGKLLPIIDNLKSAQNHIKDSGIAIIIGQLETLAREEGFEEIKIDVGDDFNHETMEVIETIETKEEKDNNNNTNMDGKVAEVVQSGWRHAGSPGLGEDGATIVRHARVKVYKYKKEEKINE